MVRLKKRAAAREKILLRLGCLMAHPKGNAVSFQTVYCWPAISHALAIGEGVPVSGTASLGPGCIR